VVVAVEISRGVWELTDMLMVAVKVAPNERPAPVTAAWMYNTFDAWEGTTVLWTNDDAPEKAWMVVGLLQEPDTQGAVQD
jgi:hypothetical protein